LKRLILAIALCLLVSTSSFAYDSALAQAAAGVRPGQLVQFHRAGDSSTFGATMFASLSHGSASSSMEFASKCSYDWTPSRVYRAYLVKGARSAGQTSVTVNTGTAPIVVGDKVNFDGVRGTYTVTSNISKGTFSFTPGLLADLPDNRVVSISREGRRVFFFGHGHNGTAALDPKFAVYEFADDKWKTLPVYSTAATNNGEPTRSDVYYGMHHSYGAMALDPARQKFYKGHVANTNPVVVNTYNVDEFDPTLIGGKITTPLTGTITITNASTTLTGSGTSFTTQLSPGSHFRISNDPFAPWTMVLAVASNTSATLAFNYTGTTCSGCAAKVLDAVNGIKADMRFEPAVNFNPSGGREALEFFPERDSLLMINNNQIWEKRVVSGGASSWKLLHTPTYSLYGSTHYDTYNKTYNASSVGDGIFAYYHPKLHAVLVGAATGGFGEYPPVLYLLKADGTLQGPLDSPNVLMAPGSGSGTLVWPDPVRNVFQMLAPNYIIGGSQDLSQPYHFLELDPTAAPGSQWTTLDATEFNNAFVNIGQYTLTETVTCSLWDLGVTLILSGNGMHLYKPSANDRAANGLTAREKSEGPGAFGGLLFGDSFVNTYQWDPYYETADPDFAAYVAGKANLQFSGGGHSIIKSEPAGDTRIDGGWGVLTADVVKDVTYKNQPGSLRMNKPSETDDSAAQFIFGFDGSLNSNQAINPLDISPSSSFFIQYPYRANAQLLQYPLYFTGHWFTRPGNGLTQPGVNSTHVTTTLTGWSGWDPSYIGSRLYVDGGSSNDPNAVGGFYRIMSVVSPTEVILDRSISKPGTQARDVNAKQGDPDTTVTSFNLTGGTKTDIFHDRIATSSASFSVVTQWNNKDVGGGISGNLHYNQIYEHGGGGGGIHVSGGLQSFVGPIVPDTWYTIDKMIQFRSTTGWQTFDSGALKIKNSAFTLAPYAPFATGGYIFVPGYGERASAIAGSPWVPGLYKVTAYDSGNDAFILASSPTGGTAATGGEIYIGFGPATSNDIPSWPNRHRLWMDGVAANVGDSAHFNFADGDSHPQPYGLTFISFTPYQTARDCCQHIPGPDGYAYYGQTIMSRQPIPLETADEVPCSGDCTAPNVSMTAPSNGATISGSSVTLSATCTDNVACLGVQFKRDGVNIGTEDSSAPYSVTWDSTTVSNGSHTVTAVARDAAGNRTTSSGVVVSVVNNNVGGGGGSGGGSDIVAPAVSITSPASTATVSGTAVAVSATASDNVGVVGVQFKLDGADLGSEVFASPYTITWNTKLTNNGSHTLTAVARDAAGNRTTSSSVVVSVMNSDTTAPSVSITSPLSGSNVAGFVAVAASASDNIGVVGVQFKLDGVNLGWEIMSAPFGITWDTSALSPGSHTLSAVARDAAGNRSTASAIVNAGSKSSGQPIAVYFAAPAKGATISGLDTISVNASGGAPIVRVQLAIDGVKVGGDITRKPFSATWNSWRTSNGGHVLSAVATDANGNMGSALVSAEVNNKLNGGVSSFQEFSVSNQIAQHWMASSAAPDLKVGYAAIQPAAGVSSPGGMAIFSYRSNGALVSEASVPASPLLQSGRIYVEVKGGANTGIAFANPNLDDAQISFYFTDTAGKNFGAGSFTLPGLHQFAAFLNQAPFWGSNSMEGTFTFTSSRSVSAVALRGFNNERNEFLMTTLPMAEIGAGRTNTSMLLPHFAVGGGWSTTLILVNPTDSVVSGTAAFRSPGSETTGGTALTVNVNGRDGSTFSYSIPPRSSSRLTLKSNDKDIKTGSIKVSADTGPLPSGLAVFSNVTDGVTVSEAGVPLQKEASAFRLFVQSSENQRTGVALANPTAAPVVATLEFTQDDQVITGPVTQTVTIPANGQVARFVNELIPDLPTTFTGMLRITSSTPLTAIGLRGTVNERNNFLITTFPSLIEGADSANGQLFFPHIVQGNGFTTEFVVFGRDQNDSFGEVIFISKDGSRLELEIPE
jgi:hypothetical protein